MRKFLLTSVALAAATLAATSVNAADFKIDGRIDMGLNFTNERGYENGAFKEAERKFQMMSGQNSTSRLRFRGTEDLGNGWKVGFTLDSGFDADDGTMKKERLWQREALLWLQGDWGEIGMGRCGVLDSGNGRYGLIQEDWAVVAGTGWEDIFDPRKNFLGQSSRQDNVFTYKSPTYNGITAYGQFSTAYEVVEAEGDFYYNGAEGTSDANRYYALGVTAEMGDLSMMGVVSRIDLSSELKAKADSDDPVTVTVGAKYALDDTNLFVAAQYYDGITTEFYDKVKKVLEKKAYKERDCKGWGLVLSADTKALGGKVYGMVGYGAGEVNDDAKSDVENWQVGLGYEYKFSKKTHAYVAAGYIDEVYGEDETHTTQAMCGLVTKF